jgi:thioredoxin 1
MIELNADNFEAEVLQAKGAVLVDFWGERCEPCRVLMPEFHKLADQYGDKIKMCTLNTTAHRRLAISQKVLGLPTIVMYKDGERVREMTGGDNCTPEAIEALIKEYI